MAHISEYKLQDGSLRYRSHVHRAGYHKPLTKAGFKYKKDAERWGTEQDRSILLTGLPQSIDKLRIPFSVFVERYLKEIAPSKGSYVTIKATLEKFLGKKNNKSVYGLSEMFVCHIKPRDVYEYIEARKKEIWHGRLIKNSTIKHDITIFSCVYGSIKTPWGYDGHEQLPPNPFAKLDRRRLEGSNKVRERRLNSGELESLEEACEHCLGLNRYYVPLAIYLAIDTAMRQQEIFNLTWRDIDLEKRQIKIRKSKTDHLSKYDGRTIVLPITSMFRLGRLPLELHKLGRFNPDARIFPMTKGAFKQSWADVRKRAKIKDLRFHDLRHEAASRFDEADLSAPERNLMLGHKGTDTGDRYVHSQLKNIQDKLDKHLMGQKLDEPVDEAKAVAELADFVEGKHGEEFQKLIAHDLDLLPGLREKVAQVFAKRSQAANIVPFAKPKAS